MWRKKLLCAEKPLEEKLAFIKAKSEKRDHIFALVLIFSFCGSLIASLLLVLFKVFGQFPRSAILGIVLWLIWIYLVYFLIRKIRRFLFKKDRELLQMIKLVEEGKRLWQEYFP